MEKRKPHYDLTAVKIAVQQRGADAFTATASVCAMTQADFYTSMTTHAASQVWQDVYHPVVPGLPKGKVAYVKVTCRADGSIVIQFKEK